MLARMWLGMAVVPAVTLLVTYVKDRGRSTLQIRVPEAGDPASYTALCDGIGQQLWGIRDSATKQAWQGMAIRGNAHRHVLDGMAAYPADVGLQRSCSNAICAMVIFNPQTHADVAGIGGIQALLRAGRVHFRDREVVRQATGGLGCIADEVNENRDKLRELGALEFGMQAWDAYPHEADVKFGVCCIYCAAGYDNPVNKQRIIDLGFPQRGIAGIRDFPRSDDRVREEVMQVFQSLAGRPALQHIQTQLIELGAIEAAATIMRENLDHQNTLTNTNRFVRHLAANATQRGLLMEAGIADLLIGQILTHTEPAWADYVNVDASAIDALACLAAGSSENQRAMVRAGARAKVEAALRAKPADGELQRHGARFLDILRPAGGE